MHAPTAPSPESHQDYPDAAQYPPAVDPWDRGKTSTLPYVPPSRQLTEEEQLRFNDILANYHDTSAPETALQYHVEATTDVPATPPEYKATPEQKAAAERRAQQELAASFALAHTLRHTNPELMHGLQAATAEPPPPANYTGRHRARSRWNFLRK